MTWWDIVRDFGKAGPMAPERCALSALEPTCRRLLFSNLAYFATGRAVAKRRRAWWRRWHLDNLILVRSPYLGLWRKAKFWVSTSMGSMERMCLKSKSLKIHPFSKAQCHRWECPYCSSRAQPDLRVRRVCASCLANGLKSKAESIEGPLLILMFLRAWPTESYMGVSCLYPFCVGGAEMHQFSNFKMRMERVHYTYNTGKHNTCIISHL